MSDQDTTATTQPATQPASAASAVQADAAPAAQATATPATSAIGAIGSETAVATPAATDPAAAQKAGADAAKSDEPKVVTPEEYAKTVTLGDSEELKGAQINPDVLNAVIPAAIELGIKPEQLSRLAQDMTRALAKQQTQIAAEEAKKFSDDFTARRQIALDTLKPEGIAEVRAALGKYMKPGSFLAHMVDMGLGNDLDFLNLCRDYGRLLKPDTATGAGEGSASSEGDYNWRDRWGTPGGAAQ